MARTRSMARSGGDNGTVNTAGPRQDASRGHGGAPRKPASGRKRRGSSTLAPPVKKARGISDTPVISLRQEVSGAAQSSSQYDMFAKLSGNAPVGKAQASEKAVEQDVESAVAASFNGVDVLRFSEDAIFAPQEVLQKAAASSGPGRKFPRGQTSERGRGDGHSRGRERPSNAGKGVKRPSSVHDASRLLIKNESSDHGDVVSPGHSDLAIITRSSPGEDSPSAEVEVSTAIISRLLWAVEASGATLPDLHDRAAALGNGAARASLSSSNAAVASHASTDEAFANVTRRLHIIRSGFDRCDPVMGTPVDTELADIQNLRSSIKAVPGDPSCCVRAAADTINAVAASPNEGPLSVDARSIAHGLELFEDCSPGPSNTIDSSQVDPKFTKSAQGNKTSGGQKRAFPYANDHVFEETLAIDTSKDPEIAPLRVNQRDENTNDTIREQQGSARDSDQGQRHRPFGIASHRLRH